MLIQGESGWSREAGRSSSPSCQNPDSKRSTKWPPSWTGPPSKRTLTRDTGEKKKEKERKKKTNAFVWVVVSFFEQNKSDRL